MLLKPIRPFATFALVVVATFSAGIHAADADPSWSAGRNAEGKLQVNAGPLGIVDFESEVKNAYPRERESSGCVPYDRVAYDWERDGYEGRPMGSCLARGECSLEDQDLGHPVWKDAPYRHVLVKNWNLKNAFKTSNGPHVDVTQTLDSPGWGGWFAMQDSTLKNSDDGIVQWQFGYQSNSCPAFEGKEQRDFGGIVVQNVTLNQESAFQSDCRARAANSGAESVCAQGNYVGSYNGPHPGWFINYHTNNWTITLQQSWQKVVVVGELPRLSFRTGSSGSLDFSVEEMCDPNKNVACSYSNRVFGPYPSIEAAIADGHAEPPFVRLSCSGWANTANCSPGQAVASRPSAPRLEAIE